MKQTAYVYTKLRSRSLPIIPQLQLLQARLFIFRSIIIRITTYAFPTQPFTYTSQSLSLIQSLFLNKTHTLSLKHNLSLSLSLSYTHKKSLASNTTPQHSHTLPQHITNVTLSLSLSNSFIHTVFYNAPCTYQVHHSNKISWKHTLVDKMFNNFKLQQQRRPDCKIANTQCLLPTNMGS